ncbi:Hypothetical protein FKW44_019227, partial [Caligus rogercresseyi]
SEEDDDSNGVHLQPWRVSITALPAGTTADWNTIRVPEDDWEVLFSAEKDKIRLKDCLLMWDMH